MRKRKLATIGSNDERITSVTADPRNIDKVFVGKWGRSMFPLEPGNTIYLEHHPGEISVYGFHNSDYIHFTYDIIAEQRGNTYVLHNMSK